ncbi:phospholipase A2 inhibitor gamma subunit B-like [Mixophyes fleayi]|uniref:phospholipase A2 inhibitor gamma subunit B-like n=1 Tax=Mixophyes fleayi TaxID=3061075 RepID=UPI003F4D9AAD
MAMEIFMKIIPTNLCYSLSCIECLVQGASFCTGNNVTCPPGRVCAATHTVNIEDGIQKNEFCGRSCVPENQCQGPGSFSTYNSKSKKGFSCCYTDNCTPTQPVLPDDNFQPNGLTCRTCVSANSSWCYTEDTIQCTGNENMCLLQTNNIYGSSKLSTALRGCATKSICDFGTQSSTSGGVNTKVSFSCTSGSFALRSSQFVSSVIAIAVAKMMYF